MNLEKQCHEYREYVEGYLKEHYEALSDPVSYTHLTLPTKA